MKIVKFLKLLGATLMMVTYVGCASMDSTMLARNESNSGWERHPHLRGVPITVKVPTHVKLYVYEKHFFIPTEAGIRRLELPYAVRDFSYDFIESEKIFTVDFKRPGAGDFNLRLDMKADQYIDKVQHDVTDKTLEDVTALIGSIAPGGIFGTPVAPQKSAAETAGGSFKEGIPAEHLKEVNSVVAVGMFEIDAPDFEQQITEFVNCHLNKAHDAFVVPSNVKEIKRAELPAGLHQSDFCNGIVQDVSVHDVAPGNAEATGQPPLGESYFIAPPSRGTKTRNGK